MTKDEIKEMVKQAVRDMVTTEMTGVANVTGNAAGFDGPFGDMSRRKLKDLDYASEEEDDEDD